MTTPISSEIRAALLQKHPEAWVDHLIASFPPEYFEAFGIAEISEHLELLRGLSPHRLLKVKADAEEPRPTWSVTVVGYDAFQMLSTVCTLLAVHGWSIVEARVFTSEPLVQPQPDRGPARFGIGARPRFLGGPPAFRKRPPRASSPPTDQPDQRRKIVDHFRLRRVDGFDAIDWAAFEEELAVFAVLLRQGQHDEVHHRLIGRLAAAMGDRRGVEAPLEPVLLSIASQGPDKPTRVHVRSRDTFGFFALTTGALALSGLRVVRADVRADPSGELADDTLYVTDRSGRPVTDEDRLTGLRHAIVLIEHFSERLPLASDPEAALIHFSRFANEVMSRPDRSLGFTALDRPEVLEALVRVLGESRFLWEDYLHAQPETVLPLIGDPEAWRDRPGREELAEMLTTELKAEPELEARVQALRRFKDREIFRADVRSILGLSGGAAGFAAELTDVAEVITSLALELAAERLAEELPEWKRLRKVPVSLCALGKFGGRELGFASDLELMIVFDDHEARPRAEDSPATEVFDRLVSAFRKVLGVRRGSTFEPDFRLRPYGKSGPPATALSLFESYYRPGGAAWSFERQALIRFRAVAGDPKLGRRLEALRDAFVYGPEPFDVESLRSMRELQVKQLVRPGSINAKFSPGALVDVEYAVQAHQIVQGRRNATLRSPNTLEALEALRAAGHVSEAEAELLHEGHGFFRSLVGALRVVRGNADDLTVPPADSEDFALLARRLRYPGGAEALRLTLPERLAMTKRAVDRLLEALEATERDSHPIED